MPAAPSSDGRHPGDHPGTAWTGLPGRVQLAWTMAGGVLAGGLLMVLATVTHTMNSGLALYSTSVFFLLGAVLGLVHGLALAVVGRPLRATWTETVSSLGLATLAVVPGVLLAWVTALFISMTPLSLSLGRPLLWVAVAGGWTVGLSICAWAALEGYRAFQNALVRWPEARTGGPLITGVFVAVLVLCLKTDPQILRIRISGWSSIVLAVGLTIWVGLPLVVLAIHLFKRLGRASLRQGGDPA